MGVELLSVFLLMQAHFCWSQYTMITPSQPITASVGSDVTLPCQLDPVKNLRDMVVEWARQDLTPPYIHIRRDGLDFLLDQNSLYLGRTALSESPLQKGDMSLRLTRVKPSDGGTYRCYIPQIKTEAEVTLLVVSVAPPSVSLTKERSGSPVLRCESRGWYPKPELEWLDSEGTVLLRTEAQRGASDELFTVSSRLSVEQRLGNTFTCRVRQQESGQSREAQLILTDEFLEVCSSCSVAWVLFGLLLCLAAAAAAFVVWKFKINKSKPGTKENKDCEEAEPMLKTKEKNHYEEQKLIENQEDLTEELNFVNDLSQKLMGTKAFLVKLKDRVHQDKCELISVKEEKKKKIKSTRILMPETKKEKLGKIDDMEKKIKEFEDIIQNFDKEMTQIDGMIWKTSEKKGKLERDKKQMTKRVQKEKQHPEATVQPETEKVVVEDEGKENFQKGTVKTLDQMTESKTKEGKEKNQEVSHNSADDLSSLMNNLNLESQTPVNTPESQATAESTTSGVDCSTAARGESNVSQHEQNKK